MFIFPIEWSLLAHFKTRYAMLANVGPSVVRLCTIHRLLSVPWSSPFLSLRGRMCPFHIPVLRPASRWPNARPQGWDKCSIARHRQACLMVCVKTKSFQYVVNCCFGKILNVISKEDIEFCTQMFNCPLVDLTVAKRKVKF